MIVSPDGQTWYEATDEQFQRLLDDPEFDCWVDLSHGDCVHHVTLRSFRKLMRRTTPDDLGNVFGIPVKEVS